MFRSSRKFVSDRQKIEEYLKLYCIEEILDETINDIIERRPTNPYVEIAQLIEAKTMPEIIEVVIVPTLVGGGRCGVTAKIQTNLGCYTGQCGYPFDNTELFRDYTIASTKIGDALKKSPVSSIFKSMNSFRKNFKGVFLTHINNIPVFSKPDAVKQLKLLKDRGVSEFSITFAPERPITGKKLRHAIDDYHHFSPGNAKKIKSKHVEEPADDMSDVDDNSTRFHLGTVVFKVFGKVEHKGEVTGYNPVTKLY